MDNLIKLRDEFEGRTWIIHEVVGTYFKEYLCNVDDRTPENIINGNLLCDLLEVALYGYDVGTKGKNAALMPKLPKA